jgi:nucleoside-diphosphate-sugar epimerase
MINIKYLFFMQTILGASGVIGRKLAKELFFYTDNIRLVSRNPQKINETDELFTADLTIPHEVEKSVEGSDIVYLTVGLPYRYGKWKNDWPPLMMNVINACKRHKAKLVFFDNVYMYDRYHIGNMTEDTPVRPTSKKGEVRANIAKKLWDELDHGKIDAIIARAADFIGPQNSILTELVYNKLRKGKKANWLINANKIHNFTNTIDAAKGTAILGNTPDAYNQIWHLPTDKTPMTGKEWIELFAKEMNAKTDYREIPMWQLGLAGIFKPLLNEVKEMGYQYDRDYFFDSSKFNERFSFTPYTPEESVKDIITKLQ